MTNFKILYCFESELLSLIELKRFLPNETDKSKVFFWLLFDKQDAKLKKLNFVSMRSDGDTELRFFENEQLSFDTQRALLILNSEELQLEAISSDTALNIEIQQTIDVFLEKL